MKDTDTKEIKTVGEGVGFERIEELLVIWLEL